MTTRAIWHSWTLLPPGLISKELPFLLHFLPKFLAPSSHSPLLVPSFLFKLHVGDPGTWCSIIFSLYTHFLGDSIQLHEFKSIYAMLTTCKHIFRPHLSSGLIQTTSSPSRQGDLIGLLFSSGPRLNFVSSPQIYSLCIQVNGNSNFPLPSAKTSVPSLSSFPYHHNYSVKKSFCTIFKMYPEADLFGSPLGGFLMGAVVHPPPHLARTDAMDWSVIGFRVHHIEIITLITPAKTLPSDTAPFWCLFGVTTQPTILSYRPLST